MIGSTQTSSLGYSRLLFRVPAGIMERTVATEILAGLRMVAGGSWSFGEGRLTGKLLWFRSGSLFDSARLDTVLCPATWFA